MNMDSLFNTLRQQSFIYIRLRDKHCQSEALIFQVQDVIRKVLLIIIYCFCPENVTDW